VVGRDADRRFTRYMRRVMGRKPPVPPVRHPIVYGGGAGTLRAVERWVRRPDFDGGFGVRGSGSRMRGTRRGYAPSGTGT
jgi:hypothetical protein